MYEHHCHYLHPVVYRECHQDIVWNFALFIHTKREFKQDPSLGKQSIWHDQLTGAQQSVKHDDNLSIGGSRLATRCVEMWCDHQRGELNVMLQSLCDIYDMTTQCIHYPGSCFRLRRCERPLCKRLWNGAQCHCRNLVQLFLFHEPSLRVLYLTMLLARHRQLVTDNHWSISGKELVFTLSIDESWDTYNINDISMANRALKLWQSILDQWQWDH